MLSTHRWKRTLRFCQDVEIGILDGVKGILTSLVAVKMTVLDMRSEKTYDIGKVEFFLKQWKSIIFYHRIG